jgi:hypothetical protein
MRLIRRLVWLAVLAAVAYGQATFTGVRRIVAVGDVHGDYETFVSVLRAAGVIDKSNKWVGGDTHLVQTGDGVDRGPDSRKVLELMINLTKQAERSKGMVHALLGNHEAMNIYGDLRYVSAGDYAAYRTSQSEEMRDRAYEVLADPAHKDDEQYRKKWYEEHPLGWIEQRQAFGPNGKFGRVLLEEDAVIKVNDILFLHGGISEKYVSTPMAELNTRIRAELKDFRLLPGGIATDEEGPLWDRRLAEDPEPKIAGLVDMILTKFAVNHIVVGHTPTSGAVTPRLGGRVLLIDVGLSKSFNQSPACLIVEDGKFLAMHRGKKIPIPERTDAVAYLRQAAELDPPGTLLRKSVGLR